MEDIKKDYGSSYRNMMAEVKDVMDNSATMFPALKGKTLELAGFVWFQGWNDQYGAENEYESNMKHFIKDVRKDLNAPKLPFVIAVMGQNGSKPATGAMLTIQKAQLAMNDVPEFKGNVKAIRTDVLVDKAAEELYPDMAGEPGAMETGRRRHPLPLPRQRDLVQPHRQGDGRRDAGTPEGSEVCAASRRHSHAAVRFGKLLMLQPERVRHDGLIDRAVCVVTSDVCELKFADKVIGDVFDSFAPPKAAGRNDKK